MTHKERAIAALTCQVPDMIPTFELEFQIEEEMFGRTFDYSRCSKENLAKLSPKERDVLIHEFVEHKLDIYVNKLEYSIVPWPSFPDGTVDTLKVMRKIAGDDIMIHCHGDGTYSIPDGRSMESFTYSLYDDPKGMKEQAQRMADGAIANNKRMAEAGIDCFILCADYCFNTNPYFNPEMFSEFIQPYLYQIIDEIRKMGCYAIKHTDGNIMPILDQLADCKPHAIHSLDPQAKVDIKEVKRLIGDKIALCGNVNCALMQTGTDEEVIESAEYAITHGKPGGGYLFCTSNVPFRGLPAERYRLILDVWKKMRNY